MDGTSCGTDVVFRQLLQKFTKINARLRCCFKIEESQFGATTLRQHNVQHLDSLVTSRYIARKLGRGNADGLAGILAHRPTGYAGGGRARGVGASSRLLDHLRALALEVP